MTGLRLRDKLTGVVDDFPFTGLFLAIGHDPRSQLFRGQLDMDDEGYITVASPSTATNMPGVFACGDVVDRTYKQAITAAGTGCAAALDAERFLADQEGRPTRCPRLPSSRPARPSRASRPPAEASSRQRTDVRSSPHQHTTTGGTHGHHPARYR